MLMTIKSNKALLFFIFFLTVFSCFEAYAAEYWNGDNREGWGEYLWRKIRCKSRHPLTLRTHRPPPTNTSSSPPFEVRNPLRDAEESIARGRRHQIVEMMEKEGASKELGDTGLPAPSTARAADPRIGEVRKFLEDSGILKGDVEITDDQLTKALEERDSLRGNIGDASKWEGSPPLRGLQYLFEETMMPRSRWRKWPQNILALGGAFAASGGEVTAWSIPVLSGIFERPPSRAPTTSDYDKRINTMYAYYIGATSFLLFIPEFINMWPRGRFCSPGPYERGCGCHMSRRKVLRGAINFLSFLLALGPVFNLMTLADVYSREPAKIDRDAVQSSIPFVFLRYYFLNRDNLTRSIDMAPPFAHKTVFGCLLPTEARESREALENGFLNMELCLTRLSKRVRKGEVGAMLRVGIIYDAFYNKGKRDDLTDSQRLFFNLFFTEDHQPLPPHPVKKALGWVGAMIAPLTAYGSYHAGKMVGPPGWGYILATANVLTRPFAVRQWIHRGWDSIFGYSEEVRPLYAHPSGRWTRLGNWLFTSFQGAVISMPILAPYLANAQIENRKSPGAWSDFQRDFWAAFLMLGETAVNQGMLQRNADGLASYIRSVKYGCPSSQKRAGVMIERILKVGERARGVLHSLPPEALLELHSMVS